MATKIIPDRNDIPVEMTQEFIRPERVRIEKELLEMERKYGGRGFAYVGNACIAVAPNAPANATAPACTPTKCARRLRHSVSISVVPFGTFRNKAPVGQGRHPAGIPHACKRAFS